MSKHKRSNPLPRAMRRSPQQPAWTVFQPAQVLDGGRSRVYVNSLYTVVRTTDPDSDAVTLSIRRNDREAVHDWRHLQRIKNELLGPDCEAVELYPAESRLVDTANQYFLWGVADPTFHFPLGFAQRLVSDGEGSTSKARQRPWAPAERPADAVSGAELDARVAASDVAQRMAQPDAHADAERQREKPGR